MGVYCCCGQRRGKEKCLCSQDGWHDAFNELPKKDGKYLARLTDNGSDSYEKIILFSKEDKFIQQIGWSEPELSKWNSDDDIVYQWKEVEGE